MASQLTRDEVAHIAGLARLDLSATELDTFARQLTDILAYAAIVQEADVVAEPQMSNFELRTSNFEPQNSEPGALRTDIPRRSLDRDAVLAEAPDADRQSGLFRVPKVL
jgi:aspartyl-tRNA(Asn)/glutamyl-tRNA(Gln) amidotransferase subunit C